MDGTTLQGKVYAGYAKAALRVGLSCSHYRPLAATSAVIAVANQLTSLTASFNAEDMTYGRPNKYGKATWYCLADGTQLQVGDYLVQPSGSTFFIAGMQPLLPILVVECNRIVNVYRPQQQPGFGAQGYGGNTVAGQTQTVAQFPASILQGTKGEKSITALPGDVRMPWWAVLMPIIPGATIETDDIITDDLSRRYVVSSAELTDLGWRITAAEVET